MGLFVSEIIKVFTLIVGVSNVVITIMVLHQFVLVKEERMVPWAKMLLKKFRYKWRIWFSLAFIWLIFVLCTMSLNNTINQIINW